MQFVHIVENFPIQRMGEHYDKSSNDKRQEQAFTQSLLNDLAALEQMLDGEMFETGVQRIGAEQEMFLIDNMLCPKPVAVEVLGKIRDYRLTTEIGRFNLEANLTPRLLVGNCFSALESEIHEVLGIATEAASSCDAGLLLTGILPTIQKPDLRLENLTPSPRYQEMNRAISQRRGANFNVHIKGVDELNFTHDNLLLEACCTSFQLHLQVAPQEFARLYNLAQLITGPVLAAAANSPLWLGHRLWHETRIALFQLSVDERSTTQQMRSMPTRVSFGESWLKSSVLEIFREEIARYRVLLTKPIAENALETLAEGRLPKLEALRLYNGTVWRWNRPCYGIEGNKAHLRIEMRALPAGPTVVDEIANAAFMLGLLCTPLESFGEFTQAISFDEVKDNFLAAARLGLKAPMNWLQGETLPAATLVLERLLPLAKIGLQRVAIDDADIDRYLNVIEQRVSKRQTGSQWAFRSLAALPDSLPRYQRMTTLVKAIKAEQTANQPIHTWPLAKAEQTETNALRYQTVGQLMSTDLFTVRPEDLIDLAARVMDWKHVRHVPVENDEGELIGIVSHRDLLHLMAHRMTGVNKSPFLISEIMKAEPITINAEAHIHEALELMRTKNIGCLPVVDGRRLVGLLTAQDFLRLTAELLERELRKNTLEQS